MSIPFLILDGYNLLHEAGLARLKYGPGDLARQRTRLLARIAGKLRPEEQVRCTVVFDAREPPPDASPRQTYQQIAILYAPAPGDADEQIEELIRVHPAPRQLVVVSGDHRLHKAVTRRGGQAVDSEVWLQQLDRRPRAGASPAPARPDPRRSADDWEQEFGEVSLEELAAEVAAEAPGALLKDEWDRHVDLLEQQLRDPSELERWLNPAAGKRSRKPPHGGERDDSPQP